jgi:Tol biopolymer transport system component
LSNKKNEMPEEVSMQNKELFMNKTRKHIFISIITLILASMACGSVQVGVVAPTLGASMQSTNVTQEPETELTVLDGVDSQIVEEPTSEPTEEVSESSIPTMAYIGPDDNIWVLETGSQTPLQITFDGNRIGSNGDKVVYSYPHLSSDGTLLAYYMSVEMPSTSGYDSTYGVWVVNLISGEEHQILSGRAAGMAWKPGTHLLAYGTGRNTDYLISLDDPDSDLATGISSIDLDSGDTLELVAPERGYRLSSPKWSPDGRFLAFSERVSMETGMFAYYDFEDQEYVAWDDYVGDASWSPDGSLLTYDRIYYVPTGEERLYLRPRLGDEQLLGPDYGGPAYASQPVFSPAGDQIAYLTRLEGPETDFATIMVLDLAGGEPKSLGQFQDVWEFSWVPDGTHLVFSFGLYPSRQIIALNVTDGSQTVLAAGDHLTLAGQ